MLTQILSGRETLQIIARDCQATALVTHISQIEMAQTLFANTTSLQFAFFSGGELHNKNAAMLPFDSIFQEGYSTTAPESMRINLDPAYLLYTSGSTGKSKGVLVMHRSSLFTIHSGIEFLQLNPEDLHVTPLPFSFSPGINQLFQTLRVGATLVLEKSFAFPAMTLKRMAAERATGFCRCTHNSGIAAAK